MPGRLASKGAATSAAADRGRKSACDSGNPDGLLEAVAQAPDGGDDVGPQFLADARHEHLDRVRIAIEILIVDMLDQLGAADDLALVMEQIGQELVLLRGELHRLAVARDLAAARIEA